MLVTAMLPVTVDDAGETDRAVVSPESGMAFLLTVRRIRLIEDVTGAGVIVAKLFGQDTGFLRICQILIAIVPLQYRPLMRSLEKG